MMRVGLYPRRCGRVANFGGPGSVAVSWSPTDKSAYVTLSGGNLTATANQSAQPGAGVRANVSHGAGKYYFEVQLLVVSGTWSSPAIGIADANFLLDGLNNPFSGGNPSSVGYGIQVNSAAASRFMNTVIGAYNGSKDVIINANQVWANNDICGVAVDLTAGKFWVAHNNTWLLSGDPASGANSTFTGAAAASLTGVTFFPTVYVRETASVKGIFASGSWNYAAPAGFGAW